eukprot:223297_1
MGNSKSKKKKIQQQNEQILKKELEQIQTNKLPDINDSPNNNIEYKTLIKWYIRNEINETNEYIISKDIINIIAMYYPFQFIIQQKALKICRTQRLKDGLKYLVKQYNNNNINNQNKSEYISNFLYSKHPYLNKTEIGEFISCLDSNLCNESEHNKILLNYFQFIHFNNLSILNAFRKFLNCGFYLPLEAPKIDRLIQVFADHYVNCNNNNKYNNLVSDDILIICYAMLM